MTQLRCESGCKAFTGGEIKHHKDCQHYSESLSKVCDDLEQQIKDLKEQVKEGQFYYEEYKKQKQQIRKLRKVKFRRYANGRLQDDFISDGLFHKWGSNYEEFEFGPGNYTVAIIELEDGTIEEVQPHLIKFCD